MIPWIQPAKRKRQMNRLGGRTPVQQQVQRPSPTPRQGSGGSIPMGGSSTTTGPAQFQQEQQASSPLGGLLAAKETYDQTNDAYKGGQNIAKKAGEFGQDLYQSGQDGITGLKNIFGNSYSPTSGALSEGINSALQSSIGGGASGSLGNQAYTMGRGGADALMNPHWASDTSNFSPALKEAFMPGLAEGTTKVAQSVPVANSGLQKGAEVVGAQGAATAGKDYLGAAGAALGVGLSVNDMFQNGINFGNVTGALGSGILGASALTVGAANAWNPVGWALLGASAVDSIFDIF
tara:strand:- start:388 stop:1263 length:876 start_codon:yes stop_codon:yes gene_type:complete